MRKYVKTYELYQFNELGESAKDKVRQWYLNDDFRADYFYNDTIADLRCLFGENSNPELEFSLAHCQGDYMKIYLNLTVDHIKNIQQSWPDIYSDIGLPQPAFTEKEWKRLKHYESASGTDIEIESDGWCINDVYSSWIDDLEFIHYRDIDYALIGRYYDFVNDFISSLVIYYKKRGYDFLYNASDEEIQVTCEDNEWEFLEDGTYFRNY